MKKQDSQTTICKTFFPRFLAWRRALAWCDNYDTILRPLADTLLKIQDRRASSNAAHIYIEIFILADIMHIRRLLTSCRFTRNSNDAFRQAMLTQTGALFSNQDNVDISLSPSVLIRHSFRNDSYNRLSLSSECNLSFSNTHFLLVLA